jgi:peptidoglycan/LPS O-acetylase OafA/YrhL
VRGPTTASRHTLLYFDVIRAGSSQMVLIGHSLNIFLPQVFLLRVHGIWRVRPGFFYMQNLGVVLFFVLSGFLVTTSLARRHGRPGHGLGQYLIERASRILVPFVPAVLLVAVMDRVVFGGAPRAPFVPYLNDSVATVAANLTMLYNNPLMDELGKLLGVNLTFNAIGTAGQFWTVNVEWWIYLSFGLIALFALGAIRLRAGGVVLLLIALVVPVWIFTQGQGLVLSWLVGMTYAFGRTVMESASRLTHAGIAATGVVLALVGLRTQDWNFYHPTVCLGVALAVMSTYYATRSPRPARRNWALVRWHRTTHIRCTSFTCR